MGKKLNMFLATLLSGLGAVFLVVQVAASFGGSRKDVKALPQTRWMLTMDQDMGGETGQVEVKLAVGVLGYRAQNTLIYPESSGQEPQEQDPEWTEFGLAEDEGEGDEQTRKCPLKEDLEEGADEKDTKHCDVCNRNAPATQACALLSVVAGVVAAAFSFLRICSTMCTCKCGDKLLKFCGLLAALGSFLFGLGAFIAPLMCANAVKQMIEHLMAKPDGSTGDVRADDTWNLDGPKPQPALILAICGAVFQAVSFGINYATPVKDEVAAEKA